ncbi:MAG: TetR/AcrR family transcriptional regulator [Acidimicrobiia bacterium]
MPRIRAASIDEHKTLMRRALLDSAKALIEEAGTAEVSISEVAIAAGVGRTTLYDYFTDRDDMIASLVEEELPHVISELIQSVPSDQPVDARLADLATRTVRFVASDPVFGVILHREAGRMSPDAQERIRESHAQLSTEMAGLYMEGVASGIFLAMAPQLAGRLIQDTIMSGAKVLISNSGIDPASVTESLRTFLLGGLGSPGGPRS